MKRLSFILFVTMALPIHARMVKEVFIRTTEEVVNGVVFSHRVDIAEGAITEQWGMDRVVIAEAEYTEALLEAEKAERKAERKAKAEERRQEERELARQQEFVSKVRVDICKKDLTLTLEVLETELAKVKDARLEPFYVFNESTFASSDLFKNLTDDLIPHARRLITDKDCSEPDLQDMQAQLQDKPTRVRELFRATVKQAINTCNDTHLLRELLEIIT